MQTTNEIIRTFIFDNYLFGEDNAGLSDADSFLEKGIIDSTGVLELITFLQDTFSIVVEDQEIIPENLDSIRNIVRFIQSKTKDEGPRAPIQDDRALAG